MQHPARPLSVVLLTLLLAVAAGCGGGGGGSASGDGGLLPLQGTATIRGFVTDPRTGSPVDGALVTLQASEGADPAASPAAVRRAAAAGPVAMTITDARGFYEFANVAPARYAVSISKDGQLGATLVVRAVSGQIAVGSIELTPIITLAGRVTAPRPPAGSLPAVVWILGKSLGALGEPVAETAATVTWRFEISGVPLVPGATHLLSYASEGALAQTAEIVVASATLLTFRGVSLAVSDFRATLPEVTLAVAPPTANQPPSANAGPDQTVAPGATVTLAGSGSDPEGRPLAYHWTQVSGPAANLSAPTASAPTFTAGDSGTYVFALVVSDGIALSAADYVSIAVAATVANRPPTATVGADQVVQAPATVTLTGIGNDPDTGQALTHRWIRISGPAATLADATAATTTFAATEPGEYVFAFTVSDGTFTSSPAFLRVTVTGPAAVNRRPTANAGEDQADVPVGATVTLTGTGTDQDAGTTLSFRWAQVLGTPVALSAPDAATTTFAAPVAGFYLFSLTVSDGALDATDYVQVLVANPANAMPVAVAGSDIAVDITNGPVQVTLDGSGSNDPDGDPLTHSWMQTGGPPASLSDNAAAQPTFTADTPGILYFSLVVADGVQLSEPSFVRVSVTGSSIGAPAATLAADPASLILDPLSPATVTLTATATPALPVSTFRFVQVSGPSATLAGAAGTRTFAPTAPGSYLFMVTADNGSAVSIPAYAEVRVSTAQNQTPVADAGMDRFGVVVGTPITLDGSLSDDPDAGPDALSYRWTQTLGPGVALTGATAAVASFTPSSPGIHEFQLEVSDGAASAASRVRVAVNHPPVAKIAPPLAEMFIGVPGALSGAGSFDPDGAITQYTWTIVGSPSGASVPLTGITTDTLGFTASHAGIYRFQLRVSDGLQEIPAELAVRVAVPAPDATLFDVEQRAPGTQDLVGARPGAVPPFATVMISATDGPPFVSVVANPVSAAANSDGSIGNYLAGRPVSGIEIGDNDPRIRNDAIFVAITDPAGTPGPFVRLANDTTPPGPVELAAADPLPAVNAQNASAWGVSGRAEPGAFVELVMSLDPVHRISPPAVTADGSTGAFTAAFNLSNPAVTPDGETYALFARAIDAAGNAGPFTLLAGNLLKDTVPPELTDVRYLPGDTIKPDFTLTYTVARPATRIVATLDLATGTDPGAPHVMTVTEPARVAVGDHAFPFVSAGVPVEGATYALTLAAYDRAGNMADYTFPGLVCDATAPSGVAGLSPATGTAVFSEAVFVSYDLSGVGEPVVKLRVYIGSMTAGEDPRTPFIVDITDSALLTAANHPGVKLPLPAALTPGILYRFTFEFADAAGNLASHQTQDIGALPNTSRVVVEKPAANGKMGSIPKATYTFSDAMATATFEFRRVSGTGPVTAAHTLAGGDLAQGLHANIPLSGVALPGGDIYNIVVRGRTANGLDLDPLTIPNIAVDVTAPTFLGAVAEQAEFGAWRKGDRVLFRFNEAMDPSAYGQLASTAALNAAFIDTAAGGSTWGNGSFDWSSDRRTLTFTVDGPTLPDFKAGDPLDGAVSTLQASVGPAGGRDEAGNLAVGGPHKLASRGDATPPALELLRPHEGAVIAIVAPIVEYRTDERLASGELRFELTAGNDPLAPHILPLAGDDLDPKPLGDKTTIDTQSRGLTLAIDASYRILLAGYDGAGNAAQAVIGRITVQIAPPSAAPSIGQFVFRNFSRDVVSTGTFGIVGEYLCVRFGPEGSTVFESILQGPFVSGQVAIAAALNDPIAAGTQIWYAWKNGAGVRSAFTSGGTVPAPPLAGDLALISIADGPVGYATFSPGGPLAYPAGEYIWTNFDGIPSLSWKAGQVASDGFLSSSLSTEDIPVNAVQAGRAVRYMREDSDGNISDYSDQDGVLAALVEAVALSGGGNGTVDSSDAIRLFFSHMIDSAPTGLTSSDFYFGSPTGAGQTTPQWPSFMFEGKINLAAWSSEGVASSITAASPSVGQFIGSYSIVIPLTSFTFTGPPNRVSVAIGGKGITSLKSPGGHIVLPKQGVPPITADGTEMGIVTGDGSPAGQVLFMGDNPSDDAF